MNEDRRFKKWWLIGWIVFEFVALLLGAISSGGGHGDYFFVKIFFPIIMYTWFMHQKLEILMLILVFIQYPMVGLIPYTTLTKRHRNYFYTFFILLNVLFLILVFTHPSEQFG